MPISQEKNGRKPPSVWNGASLSAVLPKDWAEALLRSAGKSGGTPRYSAWSDTGETEPINGPPRVPAAVGYAAKLAGEASALAAIGAKSAPEEIRAKKIADLAGELFDETAKLEAVLGEAQKTEDIPAQAKVYFQKVRPAMDAVRASADQLEKLVAKSAWPYPGYDDMLFVL